jgi:uncharacterized repeat protein (TIGR03803 family)
MRGKKSSVGLALAAVVASLVLAGTCVATDPGYVVHVFRSPGTNGYTPQAGLILDASGNLYGTTSYGGDLRVCSQDSCGTVFELSQNKAGNWIETVLHIFGSGTDGAVPRAGLVFDSRGDLYGTTLEGGTYGFGTVFELSPSIGGDWTETVLYNFSNAGSDGSGPLSSLIFDGAGNLYGTTGGGGTNGSGTVFELSPAAEGIWNETTLHSFNRNGIDGVDPSSGLTFNAAGSLFGTTSSGGSETGCSNYGCGIVFELTPDGDSAWTETVLYTFTSTGTGGYSPGRSGVVLDSAGNLYGTTVLGGTYGLGTAFELSAASGGVWKIKWLHGFGLGNDAGYPANGVTIDALGNLYGTAEGSICTFYSTAFELSEEGGRWSEQVLHNLAGLTDGGCPSSGLALDAAGDMFGTTDNGGGGSDPGGTVFEIKP